MITPLTERDYIHVMDLEMAIFLALKAFSFPIAYNYYNLGTGTSVLQLVKAYEVAKKVP